LTLVNESGAASESEQTEVTLLVGLDSDCLQLPGTLKEQAERPIEDQQAGNDESQDLEAAKHL